MAEEKDNPKVCAYLDLLGFGSYTREDTPGALNLLKDYQTILNQKVRDAMLHPVESYTSALQRTAETLSIASFEYFLPFSDSIFIVSSEPNEFIRQLSGFLLECFNFSTSQLDSFSANEEDPTRVIKSSGREEHWYPMLFRGGVSWGGVTRKDLNSILDKELYENNITNLVGPGVVEAVKLEEELGKRHKGPRIFCKPEFRQLLRQDDTRYLIAPLKDCGHYEVLWPAIEYSESNECSNELYKFDQLFMRAVRLWSSFNHKEYGIHYYKFLKLIVRAALEFFDHRTDHIQEARHHISGVIDRAGLELKRPDLMNSHFI